MIEGFLELNQTFQILANWSSGWRSLQQQLVGSIRFNPFTGPEQGSSSPVIRSLPNSFYVRFQRVSTGDGTAKLYGLRTVRPSSLLFPAQKVIEGCCLHRGRHRHVTSVSDSSSRLIQPPSEPPQHPIGGWTRNVWFIVDACRRSISLSELFSNARLAQFTIDGRNS